MAITVGLSSGFRLRTKAFEADMGSDETTPAPYTYVASNIRTNPPQTFADELNEDKAYHDLVPALQVLKDLMNPESYS